MLVGIIIDVSNLENLGVELKAQLMRYRKPMINLTQVYHNTNKKKQVFDQATVHNHSNLNIIEEQKKKRFHLGHFITGVEVPVTLEKLQPLKKKYNGTSVSRKLE